MINVKEIRQGKPKNALFFIQNNLEGQSFGELALLNDDKRSATIACKEDTHFLVLKKDVFLGFLREHYNQEIEIKIKFLKRFIFFQNWKDL